MTEVRLGEDDGRPVLLVNGAVQSVLADDPEGYWQRMVPDVKPRRALLLGLGAGTVARLLHERFGEVPLYARVDLAGGRVMELELVEPFLFLGLHPPAADRLAAAIRARA